ncbi:MAG: hypothetical protein IJ141_07355 [Lachnospiraceae bacterium]|nr:hypothetical protein [Lachnospiraceae bacterium]
MKLIVNFISAVILIEIGFFLFFGGRIALKGKPKNLTEYEPDKLPPFGTEVELNIVDVGDVFLETSNIMNASVDEDCYFIVQLENGRFIVLKTIKNSDIDKKVRNYARQCEEYYFSNVGKKPEVMSLNGIIADIPYLEDESFETCLSDGIKKMLPTRRYVRMNVETTIVNAYESLRVQSMSDALKKSSEIMVSAANNLKKFLGIIVAFMGVLLVINFIKGFLNGMDSEGEKKIIVGNDDVFKNIVGRNRNLNDVLDEYEYEEKNKSIQNIKENSNGGGLKLKKN